MTPASVATTDSPAAASDAKVHRVFAKIGSEAIADFPLSPEAEAALPAATSVGVSGPVLAETYTGALRWARALSRPAA